VGGGLGLVVFLLFFVVGGVFFLFGGGFFLVPLAFKHSKSEVSHTFELSLSGFG